jgi:hypothetical protein
MSDAPATTPRTMIARQMRPDDTGARGFLKWLQVSMPAIYRGILPDLKRLNAEAKSASPEGLGAFGESQTTDVPAGSANASTSWTNTVKDLIGAWGQLKLTSAQLDTVRKITDENLARSRQGLAPLPYDASQLGLAPTVNFGLSGSTATLVKYGAIGVGLLFILNMFGGKRRHA